MNTEAPTYDSISPYYDLMMQDRTPFIAHYAALLEPGQRSLLDIACGTGTITVELARLLQEAAGSAPVRVVGLDGSAGMLAVAQSRAPGIEWVEGDMRAVPATCGPVDLAICCYNSLQHLDAPGLGRAFRSIRAVLAPGGRFAFDIYRPNLPYVRIARRNDLTRVLDAPDGRKLEIREDSTFDEAQGILLLTWRLVPHGQPDAPPLARTSYRLWQHHPETVEAALAAAGFGIVARDGDLDGSPWNPSAKKQVLVCRAL
jgi:SAM-dependent methyltransferase